MARFGRGFPPSTQILPKSYDDGSQAVDLALINQTAATFTPTVTPGAANIGLPVLGISPLAQNVIDAGPAAYWRLGETSGQALDSIGTNHGTYFGSPTRGVAGLLAGDGNGAVNLNGSTQYVQVNDDVALDLGDVFSISMWIKPDSVSFGYLMEKGGGAYGLYINTGVVRFSRSGIGDVAHSSIALVAGETYNIVVTKNGSTRKIYINGIDRTVLDTNETLVDSSFDVFIGAATGAASPFDGVIDEVHIWFDQTLAPSQVTAWFNQGTQTFLPTVTAPASVVLGLISQTAATFSPTVTPGAVSITVGLINQAAATFTPTVTALSTISLPVLGQTTYAADAFGGSESGTWGNADVGGAWTPDSSEFSVAGGVGVITAINPAGSNYMQRLASVSALDVDLTVKYKIDDVSVSRIHWVGVRLTGSTTGYFARVAASDPGANSMNLALYRDFGNQLDVALLSGREGDPAANTFYYVRIQAIGANPTTLRAKSWKQGNSEPAGWDVETTDSESAYQVAGSVGVGTNFATQTGTIIASWDDLSAVSGETTVQAFAPTITTSNAISLGLINQTAATFAPTVTAPQSISVALLDRTAATFTPTITTANSISLALINQTAATFSPTVTPGAAPITLGLINQTAATFTPTVTTLATVAFDIWRDTFSRSVTDGWGTSDSGDPWVIFAGAASQFDVDGSRGLINVNVENSGFYQRTTRSAADVDVTFKVRTDKLAAGADHAVFVHGRFNHVTSHYYRIHLTFKTTGAINLIVAKNVTAGFSFITADTATGLTHQADTDVSVRFQVIGSTIRAKAWQGSEPVAWTVSVVDTDHTEAGSLMLAGWINTGSTVDPVLFSFDDLTSRNGLIDQTAAPFAPTITTLATISLARTDQLAATFNPTVTPGAVNVSLALINQTAATFSPTVTSLATISLGLINQTAAPFAPVVVVDQDVSVGLINQTAATFTPAVTTLATISPALINQAAATFAPTVTTTASISLGLITQTATTFAPTISALSTISVGLIDRTAATFTPTVLLAQTVSVGLISQPATTFTPTVSAGAVTISLGLIDRTAVTFAPSTLASQQVDLGLINQVAATFAPTITTGLVVVFLGLINQAAQASAPTVTTSASIVLARIDRTAVTSTPSVSKDVALPLLSLTAQAFAPVVAVQGTQAVELGLISQQAATYDLAVALAQRRRRGGHSGPGRPRIIVGPKPLPEDQLIGFATLAVNTEAFAPSVDVSQDEVLLGLSDEDLLVLS